LSGSPEPSPFAGAGSALVLGASCDALTATLTRLGASVTLANAVDEALGLLDEAEFAFLLVDDVASDEVDRLVKYVRNEPRLLRLPIVVLSPLHEPEGSLAPASTDRDRARPGAAAAFDVWLAPRGQSELLESQLGLLLELQRTRARSLEMQHQLEAAQVRLVQASKLAAL